jgi:hypothetical protein
MKSLIALGMFLAVFLAGCAGPSPQTQEGKGRVVFTVADAAADMGAVSSVKVTVDRASVYSASKGWVEVSSAPKTYDLMELKASGEQALLADAQLDSGTYSQMRLDVSKVVVTDAQGQHEAKMPSGQMTITGNLEAKADSTSTATFDFIAHESLHVTSNGEYVMAPVVQVETKDDADVEVESDGRVVISGGTIRTSTKVGMDINGNVGVGLNIPVNANLTIMGGILVIGEGAASGSGRIVVGVSDTAANMGSVSKVKVTVDKVMVQSATKGWVEVSSTPKTYDLLDLKAQGATALYADAQLEEGAYNQIRMDISHVVVTDASGDHEAKLPSGELKVVGDLVVKANQTSTATFDFFANESLHVTGNGQYVLAPVVKVETREDASADVQAGAKVKVSGGKVRTSVKVGMDANGAVGVGVKIPANATISIGANGKIVVGVLGGNGTIVDVGGSIG